ncbi:ion transporter [Deinococcus hopiensis]|uniref:Voltage-gated potassium channel n=1 Tax=Deinococcus hopiensis KR-140 TaxID=695939 RepID=A0A1W1VBS8_9DEIO|nr:ion transporter [Deinococcus hopiensis]SMB90849.1 voltage-gated potassium channel [Deinococcus hopiensis KR-140]
MRPSAPTFQARLYTFLDPGDGAGPGERAFNTLLVLLILLNVTVTVLSTVPEVLALYRHEMRLFELFSGLVFTLEYLARLYVVPLRPGFTPRQQGHLRYALSPLPLIDLLVIVVLLTPGTTALASLRGLRLLKLLSLLRLGHYSNSLLLIGRVIQQRAGELISTGLIVLVLVFIAASLLYQVESGAGTKGFESIPHALWWAVVTLTTTGYGDVYPATPLGKVLAGTIMLFGVGMVALPAGMIASGFAEELARLRQLAAPTAFPQERGDPAHCPHCGGELSPPGSISAHRESRAPWPPENTSS